MRKPTLNKELADPVNRSFGEEYSQVINCNKKETQTYLISSDRGHMKVWNNYCC
jgi:hypothetical protein